MITWGTNSKRPKFLASGVSLFVKKMNWKNHIKQKWPMKWKSVTMLKFLAVCLPLITWMCVYNFGNKCYTAWRGPCCLKCCKCGHYKSTHISVWGKLLSHEEMSPTLKNYLKAAHEGITSVHRIWGKNKIKSFLSTYKTSQYYTLYTRKECENFLF